VRHGSTTTIGAHHSTSFTSSPAPVSSPAPPSKPRIFVT
jgi:hypothetical protein